MKKSEDAKAEEYFSTDYAVLVHKDHTSLCDPVRY